ncbi:PIN domain-containing protein [Catellatospora sp. KI3]|uniref:type II toxin-antitoxin system VapC family toxin n=1 Tax=Catellatospora sp. KI3 TaxID=3041620 RepID=UPI002482BE8E|nr:PIN domain-containing protein [Catellatospora sp. KI3]MDI1459354.1 PIN domain-containing protein [Catellatospora sp. KI3]
MAGRLITATGTLMLDSEGLSKLADGHSSVRAHFEKARARRARVAVSAITLTEVLRGVPRDAKVHRALSRVVVIPISAELGRRAGELLGKTGLSGHRYAIDAIVAATALEMARPVVLLTSDPDDLSRLVEEPDCPKEHRVVVVHV